VNPDIADFYTSLKKRKCPGKRKWTTTYKNQKNTNIKMSAKGGPVLRLASQGEARPLHPVSYVTGNGGKIRK